jgi:mRNA degradation ribonuclease J1/J2
LDAVILTHGHLDHIGRWPLLTRHGYKDRCLAPGPRSIWPHSFLKTHLVSKSRI